MDSLAAGRSPVHSLHPLAKLIVTVVYIVVVISCPPFNPGGLAVFLCYPLIIAPLSGTPLRPLFARLAIALPFSLAGAVSNLFLTPGAAFRIGSFVVGYGLLSFASIILKTLLTVFAALLLVASTPFEEINRQLTALGVPKIFCLQLVMTYRYLSVLIDEALTMTTAYALRAPEVKGVRFSDIGVFLGQLILRSFGHAEHVYQAMKCRGFDGGYQTRAGARLRPRDFIYTAAVCAGVVLLRVFL
jgi:cobalt/nickel transport system permease protein